MAHFSYSRACTSAWDTCGVRVCFSCLSLWEQRPPRARPSPGGELRHKKAETRLLRPPRCRNWHAGASARQRGCWGQLSLGRVGGVRTATRPSELGTVRTGRGGRILSKRYSLHARSSLRITTNTSVEPTTSQVPTSICLFLVTALGREASSLSPLCSQTNLGRRRLSTLPR